MKFDVWICWTNGRTAYKAVPSNGLSLDDIAKPQNAVSHLDRVSASNKKAATHQALKNNDLLPNRRRPLIVE